MVAPSPLASLVPWSVAADGAIEAIGLPPPPYPDPFLAQTIARAVAADAPVLRLDDAAAADLLGPATPPVLLIGHVGRSGSTLLTRLLDATGALASFREPPALSDVLADAPGSTPVVVAWLAHVAAGAGRSAVVKLPSTDSPALSTIALPPGSRRVALVRHPCDVAARVLADPPVWLLDQLTGADPASEAAAMEAAAIVGAAWNRSAEASIGPEVDAVLTYHQLVDAPWDTACRAAGVELAPPPDHVLATIVGTHAKSGTTFDRGAPPLRPALAEIVLAAAEPARSALAARGIIPEPDPR